MIPQIYTETFLGIRILLFVVSAYFKKWPKVTRIYAQKSIYRNDFLGLLLVLYKFFFTKCSLWLQENFDSKVHFPKKTRSMNERGGPFFKDLGRVQDWLTEVGVVGLEA